MRLHPEAALLLPSVGVFGLCTGRCGVGGCGAGRRRWRGVQAGDARGVEPARPGEERTLTQLTANVFADILLDGLTAHDNLAHLCPACHALKSETGWQVVHLRDGTLKWRSPTGRTFMSEPATVIRPVSPEPSAAPMPTPPPAKSGSDVAAGPAPF